jgi:ferrous iron transport protein B
MVTSSTAHPPASPRRVVLTGNPNCGKTTLFNVLTGLRAKVGNYAGVTVERKEGRLLHAPKESPVTILDLPGTYSLVPQSLDEQIARDVLLRRVSEVGTPDLVVVVVDASNLERNLYYATQVLELGYPTAIALNMVDVAESNGMEVDAQQLSAELGAPVFPMVASVGSGLEPFRGFLLGSPPQLQASPRFCVVSPPFQSELAKIETLLVSGPENRRASAWAEALLLVTDERNTAANLAAHPAPVGAAVRAARTRLDSEGIEWRSASIEARYQAVSKIHDAVLTAPMDLSETFSDRCDRVVTHRVWGTVIFVAVMFLMFQSIFTFAQWPMGWLEAAVTWLGDFARVRIPSGDLQSLIVDGAIAGVGSVVVFLPQICLLFLGIGLLEDTGYMARAAFLMDRLMSKVGLHGKSFIPMLSSFACAIPGIMATRTIESPKDRLVTILVAPLMSCSARLPVYALLIAACIPDIRLLGVVKLAGLMMLAMYLLGIVVALLMAWLFKKTLLKGEPPLLIMELPPYKRPVLRVVARHMWDRSRLFLRRAGTVILGINILLWFFATYPRSSELERRFEEERTAARAALAGQGGAALEQALREINAKESGERLRYSMAGRLGHWIEPVIAPLGFDWKIGVGIVASFAAREVFVSTMSVVYNVGDGGDGEGGSTTLERTLRQQRRPDGTPMYSPLLAVTLMVFYVFALQCVSTVAVVRRETNGWKWPLFQWAYMGGLAWGLAFITWHGGRWLGFH